MPLRGYNPLSPALTRQPSLSSSASSEISELFGAAAAWVHASHLAQARLLLAAHRERLVHACDTDGVAVATCPTPVPLVAVSPVAVSLPASAGAADEVALETASIVMAAASGAEWAHLSATGPVICATGDLSPSLDLLAPGAPVPAMPSALQRGGLPSPCPALETVRLTARPLLDATSAALSPSTTASALFSAEVMHCLRRVLAAMAVEDATATAGVPSSGRRFENEWLRESGLHWGTCAQLAAVVPVVELLGGSDKADEPATDRLDANVTMAPAFGRSMRPTRAEGGEPAGPLEVTTSHFCLFVTSWLPVIFALPPDPLLVLLPLPSISLPCRLLPAVLFCFSHSSSPPLQHSTPSTPRAPRCLRPHASSPSQARSPCLWAGHPAPLRMLPYSFPPPAPPAVPRPHRTRLRRLSSPAAQPFALAHSPLRRPFQRQYLRLPPG